MIEWPSKWDPEEGWPSSNETEPPLTREPRQWVYLAHALRSQHLLRFSSRIEALGGPPEKNFDRTIEGIKEEILAHYNTVGKRPTQRTSKKWRNDCIWLLTQKTSLHGLCNELALPGGRIFVRSMEGLKREILTYYESTRERPTETTSKEWMNRNAWVRTNEGTSLHAICNEMKLPGGNVFTRSIDEIKKGVQEHFKATGERPTERTSEEWRRRTRWLRAQGIPLNQLCNELKLPGGRNTLRSVEGIRKEIRSHYEATGRRPAQGTSPEWANHDLWLRKQGSSVPMLCNAMGLPSRCRYALTFTILKREIREYFKQTGERPICTSPGWRAPYQWIRRNGSTLRQLCNEMKLPRRPRRSPL